MVNNNKYTPVTMYRLPWNLNDNIISWLEPTSKCNIHCDGCYRENRNNSHKSLLEISRELDVFEKFRRTDGVSIAGGEPLLHPNILEIVEMVAKKGWKPNINTNGVLLTGELLGQLKKAGLHGLTVHIDSRQERVGFKGINELELNQERLRLANLIKDAGGLTCSFNATIYPETLQYVPALAKWAQEHIDKVQVMVFIIYRMANLGKGLDFYAGNEKVDFENMTYSTEDENRRIDITSQEVVEEIRKEYPDFMPSAFLNGTHNPETYKWLLTGRIGNKHKIMGYTGPKFMELMQIIKHIFTDSYLAYADKSWMKRGRLYYLLAPFDKGVRKAAAEYFKSFNTNLKAFCSRQYYQSVMIIQPADIHENGDVNMCDGCPDITVWEDKLVWSCRMEEQYRWGQNVKVMPKEEIGIKNKNYDEPNK